MGNNLEGSGHGIILGNIPKYVFEENHKKL
jgi:hypothetical protein